MRYGTRTEAKHRLPDRYEITKVPCQLFRSTECTVTFLDQRNAARAKQLGLESSAHRRQSPKPSSCKRKHDRARAKALRWKLHDLPRAIWQR